MKIYPYVWDNWSAPEGQGGDSYKNWSAEDLDIIITKHSHLS